MNPAEQMPEYELTDSVNEEMNSGIQKKPGYSESEVPIELGEHIQELQEGDTPEDAMELLSIALREARENQEPEAVITCVQENDEACAALEDELKQRVTLGSIDSYIKESMSGRIGFRIILKKDEAIEEAA